MSFAHSILAFGIALGAVPILIHLLTRRRHKVIRWGAMKYLLAAIEESSKRVQIEDMILLALRVLAVCLLALALARPFIGGSKVAPAEPRLAVLVVDNSPSMSVKRGGISRWDQARSWARDLMKQLPSGSAVAIVPMTDPTGASGGLVRPTRDFALATDMLDKLPLSGRRADPAAACRAAAGLVVESDQINRVVYLVSDFQVNDWSAPGGTVSAELKNLLAQEGTSLTAVQFSAGELDNSAVAGLERTLRIIKVDSPAQITASLTRHYPPGPLADDKMSLTGTLFLDGKKADSRTTRLQLKEPGLATAPAIFFATLDKEGCHAVEVRLTPDLCPADDVRYLAVEAREEVRVLCVDGDIHPGEEWLNATYYLRLALTPTVGSASPITVKVVAPNELALEDLKNYDVIALANVPQIDPTRARDLAAFVRSGKAVVVFLGDLVDVASYNATLFGNGPDGLMAAHLGSVLEASKSAPATPAAPEALAADNSFRINTDSLAGEVMGFFASSEQNRGGLPLARFTKAMDVNLAEAKNVFIHAKLSNGQPLLFSAEAGQGRIAVVNTTADIGWGNLPPRPAFIPLVQRLVVWLMEPASRCRNLAPGQEYRLDLPLSAIHTTVTIKLPRDPNDASAVERTESLQPEPTNDHAFVKFSGTRAPGFYEVSWASPDSGAKERRLFAVNIDPAESDLTAIQPAGLRELAGGREIGWLNIAGPAAAQAAQTNDSEAPAAGSIGGGQELWWPILLAALAALAAETYLARRFSSSTRTSASGGLKRK